MGRPWASHYFYRFGVGLRCKSLPDNKCGACLGRTSALRLIRMYTHYSLRKLYLVAPKVMFKLNQLLAAYLSLGQGSNGFSSHTDQE